MEDGSEFSAVPIREEQFVAWPRVAAISAMVGFSILTFLTGIEVFSGLSPAKALWALLIGSLLVVVIGSIMGYIGAADRMSSYLLVRVAFGDRGAAVVNIAFAISLMGWFGLNINLFMDTVGRLAQDLWGLNIPRLVLAIIASVNLGLGAFIIVIAGTWALNSLNLYSTVLSTKATFPNLNTKLLTIVLGIVGVAAALLNILGQFEIFLWYLSIIFIPVAGVIIIDRLFLRPEDYNLETLQDNKGINLTAVLAWAVGAVFAILADRGVVPTLTKVGAMDALVLSAVLYFLLSKFLPTKRVA